MKGAIRVMVTKEDIKNGKMDSVSSCPIALSLVRKFGVKAYVGVNTYVLSGREQVWDLSLPAQNFIRNFDNGQLVSPATFVCQPGRSWWRT